MENKKRFLNFFNLKVKKDSASGEKKVVPTDDNGKNFIASKENSELYDYYFKKLIATSDSWEGRVELIDDCNQMYLSNPIISRNVKNLVFEALQRDLNDNPVKINSPNSKTIKKIQKLFDRIGLNNIIQDIAFQVVLHGNSLGLLSFSEEGVSRMIVLPDTKDFKNRIEFNISEVKKAKTSGTNGGNILSQAYNTFDRMKFLVDNIDEKSDESDEFVDYLLGYEVNEQVFPVWRGIHFRYNDVIRPFKGFGTPFFINSISPHTQYVNALILQAISRTLRIPTDVYKITMGEGMSPSEKLKKVIQFMAEFQNSGIGAKKKDAKGIGEVRYTIEGLYDWEQKIPDIDLGKIDDIEMLRDDVIVSGILPKEWIDPADSGWGDTGVALKEKSKPFQRAVYAIQSSILEGLTLLVKLDIIESGENLEDHPFSLSLPYPQAQVNTDIISAQKDQLDLAEEIITALTDRLNDGEELPPDLIFDIYRQFLPYDDKNIEDWYKKIKKGKESSPEEESKFLDSKRNITESLKKQGYRNLKEAVETIKNEILIETKREGIFNEHHFYSCKNKSLGFDPSILSDYRVSKIKNLTNGKKDLTEKEKFDLVISGELSKITTKKEGEDDTRE